jgi:hypothetical protein
VEVSKIAGSVGRAVRLWLYADEGQRRQVEARGPFRRGIDLPPVRLCELGGRYFVHDGNRRVSVARFHGVEWVDAEGTDSRPWFAADPSTPPATPDEGPRISPATP